jgi:hypothetical protein
VGERSELMMSNPAESMMMGSPIATFSTYEIRARKITINASRAASRPAVASLLLPASIASLFCWNNKVAGASVASIGSGGVNLGLSVIFVFALVA